jgi:hypothetical protein
MIWERALPSPRVIDIHQRKLKKTVEEWEEENNMRCSGGPLVQTARRIGRP